MVFSYYGNRTGSPPLPATKDITMNADGSRILRASSGGPASVHLPENSHEGRVPSLHLLAVDDDERARLEVWDDGPGVPEAIQARIFDPFFSTKAPGVGTGLWAWLSCRASCGSTAAPWPCTARPMVERGSWWSFRR
jgi:hypothetical protein